MKKWLITLFIILFSFASANAWNFNRDLTLTGTDGIWTDSRSYADLATAVAAIEALAPAERDLYIARSETVGTLTIGANVRLHFVNAGAISVTTQLTLNTTQIFAKDQPIFTGAGDIDFIAGSVVRSSWFSDFDEALDVTNDDTLTMVISEAVTMDDNGEVGTNVTLRWESPFIINTDAFALTNLKNIEAGSYQIFAVGADSPDFLAGSIVHSSWFTSLRIAVTATGDENTEITILIDQPEQISANVTLDTYQHLEVEKGCIISIDDGDTLTTNGGITAGSYQIFDINTTGDVDFPAGSVFRTSWFSTLILADTATNDDNVDLTLLVDQPETIDASVATDAYQVLEVEKGCNITIDAAQTLTTVGPLYVKGLITGTGTLTINGPFEAGLYQVFGSSITVAGSPIVSATSPEWWGAVGDGTTEDYTAVNAALVHWYQRSVPGIFKFTSGKDYLISTPITLALTRNISGGWNIDGYGATIVSGVTSGTLLTIGPPTTSSVHLTIAGISIWGSGTSDSLLTLNGGDDISKFFYGVAVRDVSLRNFEGNGLSLLGNFFESVIDNVSARAKATNTTGYPIYAYNGAGSSVVSSVTIRSCNTSSGLYGIYVRTPTGDVKVQECTAITAQDEGIFLEANFGSTVLNCHVEQNWQSEVAVASGQAGLKVIGRGLISGCHGVGNYQKHVVRVDVPANGHMTIIEGHSIAPVTHYSYINGGANSTVTLIGSYDWEGANDNPNVSVSRIGYTDKNFELTSTSGAGADDLMSYTLTDDNLGKYEGIRITAFGTKAGANDTKELKFYFGATAVIFHAAANNTNDWRFVAEIANYRDSATQYLSWVGYDGATVLQGFDQPGEDTTGGDIVIKLTGECANIGDAIHQKALIVERF